MTYYPNLYIVTTTINAPTEATKAFAAKMQSLYFDDLGLKNVAHFIIVGDKKTPHHLYEELEKENPQVLYLHPDYQESTYKNLSDSIGWNCIQRRNIGFVEAYRRGADIVATVDDDNIPYPSWGNDLLVKENVLVDEWHTNAEFFDPLSVTNHSDLWHRGYPIQCLAEKNNVEYKGKTYVDVGIQADLWDGDPDIDAMCRLTKKPCVKFDIDFPYYCSNAITPFNSQNTFIGAKYLPYYMVLPHVGRMDDIWGAYLLQKKCPDMAVVFNSASVYQDRNLQDLVTNLENEVIGYRNTYKYLMNEYSLPSQAEDAYEAYREEFTKYMMGDSQ